MLQHDHLIIRDAIELFQSWNLAFDMPASRPRSRILSRARCYKNIPVWEEESGWYEGSPILDMW